MFIIRSHICENMGHKETRIIASNLKRYEAALSAGRCNGYCYASACMRAGIYENTHVCQLIGLECEDPVGMRLGVSVFVFQDLL